MTRTWKWSPEPCRSTTSITASGTALRTSASTHSLLTILTPRFALRVFGFEPVLVKGMLEGLGKPAKTMGEATTPPLSRRPEMGRDSAWLASADIAAVFLALFGQVLLTRALSTESFGLFIIAIDAFATLFLIVDLGLPTLLARDGAKALHRVWPSVLRIYRLQAIMLLPFLSYVAPSSLGKWLAYSVANCAMDRASGSSVHTTSLACAAMGHDSIIETNS